MAVLLQVLLRVLLQASRWTDGSGQNGPVAGCHVCTSMMLVKFDVIMVKFDHGSEVAESSAGRR